MKEKREEYEKAYNTLSPSRKAKIDRLKKTEDKKRSLACELLIKKLLSSKNKSFLSVDAAENGCPFLRGSQLSISLSHCEDRVACAFSEGRVGIDIEKIRPVKAEVIKRVCTEEEEKRIAEALTDETSGLAPITLSMLCFKYDALIKVDGEGYKDYILNNIRTKYKMMLDYGSSTVWETEDILTHAAGSLCHGWSALPVYYYEIFNGEKPLSALIP